MRNRSYDNAIEDLTVLKKNYTIRSLMISDDNLTLNRTYFIGLLHRSIEAKLDLNFYTLNVIRVDTLDEYCGPGNP